MVFFTIPRSARDLFQRRTADAGGGSGWVDSPLVAAARRGGLCVLDGARRPPAFVRLFFLDD